MGPADAPPPVPLNLVGDYGGGAMFAVAGLLAAIIGARTTGQGQVVDVAMTDGTAVLTTMFHGLAAQGLWNEERGSNLLDGSKPFYRCYACADGEVRRGRGPGAAVLRRPADRARASRRTGSASMTRPAGGRWSDVRRPVRDPDPRRVGGGLRRTDACVSPVLSFAEAAAHPHNAARATFVEAGAWCSPRRRRDSPKARRPISGPEEAGERSFAELLDALESLSLAGLRSPFHRPAHRRSSRNTEDCG
jgi:alpha-methylacyl-CoA racemase